ncbi:MAG: acyl carrier protein phosphodiesterase [Salinimicrobium sp.]
MNFLAHIYLSGDNEELTVGNFMADSIKGKKYLNFPPEIQKGILLHRAIDYYTDTHPVVRKSASRLFKNYSHYSGVIIDIFYDHFLAANWSEYSKVPLEEFVANFYMLLKQHESYLPETVKRFFPYMVRDNWLLSYANLDGIARILHQMNIRTRNRVAMDRAVEDLQENYELFGNEFKLFFPDLQKFSKQKIASLQE